MGSEVRFVQLTSASRCGDEVEVCGIALNVVRGEKKKTGGGPVNGELDATTRRVKNQFRSGHVIATVKVSCVLHSQTLHGFSFSRYSI
jgi:hypothetical protein